MALQIAVNKAFLEIAIGKTPTNVEFSIQEFPYPPHIQDTGLSQLFLYFLPLMTVFSFIFLCPAVLQRVGEEKSSGTKVYVKLCIIPVLNIFLGILKNGGSKLLENMDWMANSSVVYKFIFYYCYSDTFEGTINGRFLCNN